MSSVRKKLIAKKAVSHLRPYFFVVFPQTPHRAAELNTDTYLVRNTSQEKMPGRALPEILDVPYARYSSVMEIIFPKSFEGISPLLWPAALLESSLICNCIS